MTKKLRAIAIVLALGVASVAGPAASPVAAQGAVRTITFGLPSRTANEWPEFVGDQLGFFADYGLKLQFIYTGSAAADAQQLTAGALDIAGVSSTQIIEAILGNAPLTMFAEHTITAPYIVVGKKGLTSIAQLKGKTIIIGGPNDITRVFMDKIMEAAKLKPDDYTYTYAGSTTDRFAALENGGVDAAILFPPFSFHAVSQGFPVLDEVARYFPRFLFDTFDTQTAYAKSHPDIIIAFIKGYERSVRWLDDPANKAKAIEILSKTSGVSPADALATYDLFITKLHIFVANGVAKDADIAPVLDALVKIGQLKAPVPPASRFYDDTYVNKANAELQRR